VVYYRHSLSLSASVKMNREDVMNSIENNVQDEGTRKHMLAAEAIMRALAKKLGEDEDEWGLTGLMHDIDVELVEETPESHSKLGADLARELGATEAMAHAILCHNEAHGIPRETKLDKAIFCADPLSRIIAAATLAHPDRLNGLTPEAVMKSSSGGNSTAGIKQERLAACREIGLEREELIALGIEAMKGIASELEL